MEFRQLEILVAIVETGSFSRAGERLYLSQPAVTANINSLEQELEQQILLRGNRGVQLTDSGKLLYNYALSMLNQREDLLIELAKKKPHTGQLRIAASSVPAQYLLPELLSAFQRQHEDVHTNLIFCDSTEVGRKLHDQQADIGLSGCCSFDAECEYLPIAEDKLVAITPVASQYSRLDPHKPFPGELLTSAPMIVRESGSGTRQEFNSYLQKTYPGAQLNIVAVMEDYLAIKNAVAAGMGIAVMSQRSVEDYSRLGYVLPFDLEGEAVRKLYLLRRKKSRLLGVTKDFYQFVINHMEELDSPGGVELRSI